MLEGPQNGIDPLVLAMEILDDMELNILQEYMSLLNAGYSAEEIRRMISEESCELAIAVMQKVDQELQRLKVPRRQPTKKQVTTQKGELGLRL